jgi:KUP system potassium uptake protein
MGRWREALFAYLSRNAQSANTYFRVPPNRVVELGAQGGRELYAVVRRSRSD